MQISKKGMYVCQPTDPATRLLAGPLGKSVDLAQQPLTAAGGMPAQALAAVPSLTRKRRPSLSLSCEEEAGQLQQRLEEVPSGITPLLGAQAPCFYAGFVIHVLQG